MQLHIKRLQRGWHVGVLPGQIIFGNASKLMSFLLPAGIIFYKPFVYFLQINHFLLSTIHWHWNFILIFPMVPLNVTLCNIIVWPGAMLLHITWWFVNYSHGFVMTSRRQYIWLCFGTLRYFWVLFPLPMYWSIIRIFWGLFFHYAP